MFARRKVKHEAVRIHDLYNQYLGSRHKRKDKIEFKAALIACGFTSFLADKVIRKLDQQVRDGII